MTVTTTPAPAPVRPPAGPTGRLGLKAGDGVRHDLEGLRAVAVLGVVVFHLRASWLPGGFAGVDVFFVLSGFFITGLLLREIDRSGGVDLVRFWARRARRLLPASALVIVATVGAGWLLTNPLEARRIAQDGGWAALFGMNWRSAVQGTQYLQDPNPSPFVHYWSLGVEEQFYAGWPVLLLALALLWRAARRSPLLTPLRTLAVVAAALGAASFLLALAQTRDDNSFAYFGTFERAWQLALGGLLAAFAGRLARLPGPLRSAARWVGLAAVVAFYLAASTGIVYPGRKALVPALGAALVVAAGAPPRRTRDPLARALGSWPAQLGGRYSYSWYLWHYPPLVLLPIYLDRPLRVRELGLCAVGTLAAAVLTYHLVENPLRTSRRLSRRHGGPSLALGALLVLAGVGAAQGMSAFAAHRAAHTGITTATGVRLDPQPAAAAADYPRVYADGCVRGTNDDSPDLPTGSAAAPGCRYLPDTGHGDVVLTGDSHSAVWFSAVRKTAEQHHWGLTFYARNSCPFADVTKDIGKIYTACDAYRKNLVARLVATRPSLVIVTGFDTELPPLHLRDRAGHPRAAMVSGPRSRRLFEDGYVRSLGALHRAGIRVLLIHDTPGYPSALSAPDCVLAHPDDLARCSAPQRVALPPGPNDLGAARRVGGVSTVDYTPVFCHGGRCYEVVGHTLAYRDQNHLVAPMVARLRPALARAAERTMSGATVTVRVRSA